MLLRKLVTTELNRTTNYGYKSANLNDRDLYDLAILGNFYM